MRSTDLDIDQRHQLSRACLLRYNWIYQLTSRMRATHWPPDDPLYARAIEAERAIKALYDEARALAVAYRRRN